jgi:putative sigma-54 modulation protein
MIIADGMTLNSQAKNSDLYTAIDQMVEKMERQVRGRRDKVKRKRTNTPPRSTLVDEGTSAEGEEEEGGEIPPSIQRRRILTKPMSLEEAVAQLRLSPEDVLFFIHSDSGQMNALYRNPEGEVEWVEPRRI